MDECSGVQYMERESYIVLPILQVPNFILVPGQTMPLDVSRPQEISLLQNVMSREDKTFGVVLSRFFQVHLISIFITFSINCICFRFSNDSTTQPIVDYGCTAELRSMREEEVHEIRTMVGIALGRQRFKIMERRTQLDGWIIND